MKNIVLTGMSGVGKSKTGKLLADRINWKLIDIDDLIVKREELNIDEIFKLHGEKYFRDIESLVIEKVSCFDNQIICTGGGAILRETNISKLKKNGYIFLLLGKIETIVENLNKSATIRPLLSDKNKLYLDVEKLFNSRKHIYKSTADIIIEVEGKSDSEICEQILDEYYRLLRT